MLLSATYARVLRLRSIANAIHNRLGVDKRNEGLPLSVPSCKRVVRDPNLSKENDRVAFDSSENAATACMITGRRSGAIGKVQSVKWGDTTNATSPVAKRRITDRLLGGLADLHALPYVNCLPVSVNLTSKNGQPGSGSHRNRMNRHYRPPPYQDQYAPEESYSQGIDRVSAIGSCRCRTRCYQISSNHSFSGCVCLSTPV
ncbi:hypothetical protein EDD17DRAFT_759087 [Pisolithus thermaeus]|nr:hypothetical protein EDD17DRAFT_759087 [Pisolithus thermaeus]